MAVAGLGNGAVSNHVAYRRDALSRCAYKEQWCIADIVIYIHYEGACNWVQIIYSYRIFVALIINNLVSHAGQILHAAEALR